MPTIGETLRESREKQKIDIDVAAKAVKVKTEVLEDIERNDFSNFSAPIYARGILRLYASYLGLEPETLVEEYNHAHPSTPVHKPVDALAKDEQDQVLNRRKSVVIATVAKPSDLSPRGIMAIAFVALTVGVGMALWLMGTKKKPEGGASHSTVVHSKTNAPTATAPAPAAAAPGPATATNGTSVSVGIPPAMTNWNGSAPSSTQPESPSSVPALPLDR